MTRATTLDDIFGDLAAYIRYQQEEGHRDAEIAPERLRALDARAVPVAQADGSAREPEAPAGPSPAPSATDTPEAKLATIAAEVAQCTKCSLHETRTRTVPGQGNPRPEILFVGEGPGAEEDRQGLAFVGRAGQLLTKMIAAMGLTRDEVFIGNIVKCRPPDNRNPLPDEMDTCMPYLKAQIAILQPKVIVAMGATAVKGLLDTTTGITKLRGQWHTFEGIDVMPTFHPAYLLRNASKKKEAWDDLQAVLAKLGRTPPPVKKKGN